MITICSPQLGLDPESYLGGEVYDVKTIEQYLRLGLKVEVLLPKNRKYQPNKNLHVEYLPIRSIVPPHVFNLLVLPYLFKKFSQKKIDILRIHSPYFLGLAGLILKTIYPKIKITTTIVLKEESRDFDFILHRTIKIYDHIFVLTQYLKDWLVATYQFDPKNITVVYGGVDDYLQPSVKPLSLITKYKLENKIILLNMGRLIERKNVLFLLDVLKKLKKRHQDVVLIFCGSGSQKNDIIKTSRKLGIDDSVIILNPIYGKDKSKIFNLADIFLFPTKNEGFGLVGAEAMACSKPVVASNNTCLPELVTNGKTGFLAKTSDAADWTKKIEKLIEDPRLRKKMGKNGRRRVLKDFTWKSLAQKNIKVFKELINE